MTPRTNNAARKSVDTTPARTRRPTRAKLTNEMALKYMPRVQHIASGIARRLPPHVHIGDLVSAGCSGLIDAFMKYDPSRMQSFDAYVDHRVRGAILDELRKQDPLTRDQRTFARRVTAAREALVVRCGGLPDERAIAAELGVTLAEYRRQMDRRHATAVRSEALPLGDEVLPEDPANDVPETIASANQDRARVHAAMSHLPPRLRELLRLHYDEGRTMREVGLALGVTESRVSQIHSEALVRLREQLAMMAA